MHKLSLPGLFFLALFLSLAARAQAANDNIENRRPLRAEETITSNTTGCTVQPGCVDERLTGRCIEYHNDYYPFTLQVSGWARGVPAQPTPGALLTAPGTSRLIELSKASYTLTNTLPGVGQYFYQVVAESDDPTEPPALLKQQWVGYSRLKPVMAGAIDGGSSFLDLPLARYPRGAYVSFLITNPQNGNLLRALSLTNQPGDVRRARLYAQPWRDAGLSQVAVAVTCRPVGGSACTEHLLLPLSTPGYQVARWGFAGSCST